MWHLLCNRSKSIFFLVLVWKYFNETMQTDRRWNFVFVNLTLKIKIDWIEFEKWQFSTFFFPRSFTFPLKQFKPNQNIETNGECLFSYFSHTLRVSCSQPYNKFYFNLNVVESERLKTKLMCWKTRPESVTIFRYTNIFDKENEKKNAMKNQIVVVWFLTGACFSLFSSHK